MSITRDDVVHVAKLARLELSEVEIERMVRDLGTILEHVAELQKANTDGVAPTAYVAVEAAPLRPDTVVPGVDREQAMREAPRHQDGGFAVPAFVDEG
jgi:aspartyl-tRNA(Asn)/glutamyl-tRNA(Gln) amidotransferase subunit C